MKAVVQANRNGFFYALDRTNGKLLLAKPYTKVSWADGIGAGWAADAGCRTGSDRGGHEVCPGLGGGHNWQATAYSPQTGLYYFGSTDGCHMYYKTKQDYIEGQWYPGAARWTTCRTSRRRVRGGGRSRHRRTPSGASRWCTHPAAGMLATAGGLVFTGDG